MVQLQVLSGKNAGASFVSERLPWSVGRAPASSVCLKEEGVWDRHLVFEREKDGLFVTVQKEARAFLNGAPFERALLRNGDVIEFGSVKARFWLSEIRANAWSLAEPLLWLGWLLLVAAEIALIVFLR